MYAFNYHHPSNLADAINLLSSKDEARPLAGGQTLIPTLKQRLASPSDLIDLSGISELKGIKTEGSKLIIGAMTCHGEVAASAEVRKIVPALAELAGMIGDPQVRNTGTIGGSLANNDPAADYPAAVLGLNAIIVTNRRNIPADDYFKGLFETALEPNELIVRVEFPQAKKAAYQKFRNPASRYAMVGVFIAETTNGIRVAVTGAGPSVFRWKEAEQALASNFSSQAVANLKAKTDGLNSDIHASAEYRAHLITVMAKRAVAACSS